MPNYVAPTIRSMQAYNKEVRGTQGRGGVTLIPSNKIKYLCSMDALEQPNNVDGLLQNYWNLPYVI